MSSDAVMCPCAQEELIWGRGVRLLAGVDEAGRGPLAGPVVAAAVAFPRGVRVEGVRDSKALSERMREKLYDRILSTATGVGIGVVDHDEIDRLNILNATFKAMHAAVAALRDPPPEHLLIDGNLFRAEVDHGSSTCGVPYTTLVNGDGSSFLVAAASVVAKVTRDRLMREYDRQYPGYDFAQNKGYGTLGHRNALGRLGPCPIHRRSFALREHRAHLGSVGGGR